MRREVVPTCQLGELWVASLPSAAEAHSTWVGGSAAARLQTPCSFQSSQAVGHESGLFALFIT